ncbi:hypothetical protein DPMN_107935 [Dreissena polymorpha]|uniref:Uncharacterized protein n=1 Tax=Dreissena polymorpha TaxID=45954 RepID=A0A9D4K7L4_DREPO|nr:hypothetical protein DPMN_107935 [Dreissena polymorpha]
MVKEKTLVEALTQKKTVAGDETVVMTHRMDNVGCSGMGTSNDISGYIRNI